MNDYISLNYALSFYSNGSSEVDLVLSRGRSEAPIAIEIKSNPLVYSEDLKGLELFSKEYPECKLYCVSTNNKSFTVELSSGKEVEVLHFADSIERIFSMT